MAIKKCKQCGEDFKVISYRKNTAKFCSRKCYYKNRKGGSIKKRVNRVTLKCKQCKQEFKVYRSQKRKFCSKECYHKWLKGKDPWNKGLKGWTKKYKNVGFKKGHPQYNTGRTHFKKNGRMSGSNHFNWKGGITKKENYTKEYYDNNRKRICKYMRKRKRNSPKIKLDSNMATNIYKALRDEKSGRHWEDLVGYSCEDLKKHLESQFKDWMNWDNWGVYKEGEKRWNIDHIKPKSKFNYGNLEDKEFRECWALENLQPLEAHKNLVKGNNYDIK